MTDSCFKLFRLKCFRKLSSSSSTLGLEGKSCGRCAGGGECHGSCTKDNKPPPTSPSSTTLIDNGKKTTTTVECEPQRHRHAYLFRSISETTTQTITSESDDDDDDEHDDVLYPLVDEEIDLSLVRKKNKTNVREFPLMRSRTEVNLLEKLFRKKLSEKKVGKMRMSSVS